MWPVGSKDKHDAFLKEHVEQLKLKCFEIHDTFLFDTKRLKIHGLRNTCKQERLKVKTL